MDDAEDEDFRERAQALRQERRERAAALAKEGLSARAIGERLGVSHPTVLEDLKAASGVLDPNDWIRSQVRRGVDTDNGDAYLRGLARPDRREANRATARRMLGIPEGEQQ